MRRHTYFLLAVLFTAIQYSPANAQIKRIGALYVNGIITVDDSKTGNVQINIFQENELDSSYKSDPDGHYQLRLDFNHTYTVEFLQEGALCKRIYFDTSMEKRTMNVPEYDMFIDLMPEDYLEGVNTSDLEFPMAIIKYNPDKRVYDHIAEYTYHMDYVISKLLAEAAIKQELEEIKKQGRR